MLDHPLLCPMSQCLVLLIEYSNGIIQGLPVAENLTELQRCRTECRKMFSTHQKRLGKARPPQPRAVPHGANGTHFSQQSDVIKSASLVFEEAVGVSVNLIVIQPKLGYSF